MGPSLKKQCRDPVHEAIQLSTQLGHIHRVLVIEPDPRGKSDFYTHLIHKLTRKMQ